MGDIEKKADDLAARYFGSATPACSLLAAKDGNVVFRKAYGMADLENGIPATPDHNFIIASNTKQFTCLAVLMLRDRGLLALDETIERFFPDFPDYRKKVTVRMLMEHTSGIPDYFDERFESRLKEAAEADTAEMLRIAKTLGGTDFEPGTQFSYSNTGYVMLGDIVRQLSGKSFGGFLETEVLAPLGMDRSFAPDYMDQRDPHQTEGYQNGDVSGTFKRVPYDMLEVGYADGNISSNTDDMLKWHAFLYGDDPGYGAEVIEKSHLKELYTPGRLADGTALDYGLGIMTGELDADHRCVKGRRELWHTGGSMGFISRVSYFPDDKVSLIMLTNWLEVPRDEFFFGFADAVFSSI